MKTFTTTQGLRVIPISENESLFEAKCLDAECEEVFFTSGSYSYPPFCPSCGKENTSYSSRHDLEE